jgi:phospholipase/carboxylesterase
VPTATEPQLLTFKDWTFRLRIAKAKPSQLLILIHGWMGDENSMWVLVRKLLPDYAILAPRGPFPVAEGGYSWREIRPGTWGMSSIDDLRPAAEALLEFVDGWSTLATIEASLFDLMGFSQGAALAYTLTLLHPERVRRLAVLSGFLPENGEALLTAERFSGKPIIVTHGRQDELIPVEEARRSVRLLKTVGAKVTYCESDTGHKASKECLNKVEMFLGEL